MRTMTTPMPATSPLLVIASAIFAIAIGLAMAGCMEDGKDGAPGTPGQDGVGGVQETYVTTTNAEGLVVVIPVRVDVDSNANAQVNVDVADNSDPAAVRPPATVTTPVSIHADNGASATVSINVQLGAIPPAPAEAPTQ